MAFKLVNGIRANNVPPIPRAHTRQFSSQAVADAFFLANPDFVQGAVHFQIPKKHNYKRAHR